MASNTLREQDVVFLGPSHEQLMLAVWDCEMGERAVWFVNEDGDEISVHVRGGRRLDTAGTRFELECRPISSELKGRPELEGKKIIIRYDCTARKGSWRVVPLNQGPAPLIHPVGNHQFG